MAGQATPTIVPRPYSRAARLSWPGWITIVAFAAFCLFFALVPASYLADQRNAAPLSAPEYFFAGESAEVTEVRWSLYGYALWIELEMDAALADAHGVDALGRSWYEAVQLTDTAGGAVTIEWEGRLTGYTRVADGQTVRGIPVGITLGGAARLASITLPDLEAHGFSVGLIREAGNVVNGLPLLWLIPALIALGVTAWTVRPEASPLHLAEAAEAAASKARLDRAMEAQDRAYQAAYQARRSSLYMQGLTSGMGDVGAASYAEQNAGPRPAADPGPYGGVFVTLMLVLIFGTPAVAAIGGIGALASGLLFSQAPVTPLLPLAGDGWWRFWISTAGLGFLAGLGPLMAATLLKPGRGGRLRVVLVVLAIVAAVALPLLGLWSSSWDVTREVP